MQFCSLQQFWWKYKERYSGIRTLGWKKDTFPDNALIMSVCLWNWFIDRDNCMSEDTVWDNCIIICFMTIQKNMALLFYSTLLNRRYLMRLVVFMQYSVLFLWSYFDLLYSFLILQLLNMSDKYKAYNGRYGNLCYIILKQMLWFYKYFHQFLS